MSRPGGHMPSSWNEWLSERAEELLSCLVGVVAVRVVGSHAGGIEEVHVVTTEEVSPKQTVRNVESALLAHLDVSVDHRRISVARTTLPPSREAPAPPRAPLEAPAAEAPRPPEPPSSGEPGPREDGAPAKEPAPPREARPEAAPAPEPGAPPEARVLFLGHQVESERSQQVRVRVTLEWHGARFVGEASCADLPRARLEALVNATLRALEAALAPDPAASRGRGVALTLDGVQLVDAFDRTFVMVAVHALLGSRVTPLTGAVAVSENQDRSAILATLQATDRRVRAFLGPGEPEAAEPAAGGGAGDPFEVWG